jgi:hypothetical protein
MCAERDSAGPETRLKYLPEASQPARRVQADLPDLHGRPTVTLNTNKSIGCCLPLHTFPVPSWICRVRTSGRLAGRRR